MDAYTAPGVPYDANEITQVETLIPTILAVGCSQSFVEACRRVAARVGVIVEPVPLDGLATLVASRKPLVLLIKNLIYDFDPAEFDLLARDVASSLLVIDHEELPFQVLEQQLGEAVRGAQGRRRERTQA